MKEYAKRFYRSKAWRDTREAYARSKAGLCENCLAKGIWKAGEIVHHKEPITPETINNPSITLAWDNLQLLCRDCHAWAHEKKEKRYKLDEMGRVMIKSGPPYSHK
ncbi:MAG: HNH endonuclease [Acutalibacteraceae bacterium]